jgi:uncharacterized protein (TIGR00661 family)
LERSRRILVAPLDWGLGHATRCIPIIRQLLHDKNEVFIASNGAALILLRAEFPKIKSFELPGYEPVYPSSGSMVKKMALQLPKFMKAISDEHRALKKIVAQNKIDIVISDNRYGCYNDKVKSILITHQVNILMPGALKWMQKDVNNYNTGLLNRFTETWVPVPAVSPIPELTATDANINLKHIGFLSRFSKKKLPAVYKLLVICTGPEPQRGIFEDLMREQLQKIDFPVLLVRGVPDSKGLKAVKENNLTIIDFLDSEQLNDAIECSELIVSRSGYSTVMDMAKLGKKAVFIPTPGQTEQEYIAEQLTRKVIAYSTEQKKFKLAKSMEEAEKFTGFVNMSGDEGLLRAAIESM